MPKIFLSYRREDSLDVAGRIHDRLVTRFGKDSVFMDVDSIPFGVDFRAFLSDWVGRCDVLLVIIGDHWLEVRDLDGNARLGDPGDFVTIEIAAAMERQIPVIPVLVGQAEMPRRNDLPKPLSQLAYRNGAEVRSGRDFHNHMDRLIRGIEQQFHAENARSILASREIQPPSQPASAQVRCIVVEPPAVARPTNLGFEVAESDGMPGGWFNSVPFVGGVSTDYDVAVVPRTEGNSGRCVRMQRSRAGKREFGSLMQRCPIHNFSGKRLRVAAELRTENLESWAGLWVRIDGSKIHLFLDNMHDRPIRGTTQWTEYAIETKVPPNSEWLNYGILLLFNGTLWADNFKVRVSSKQDRWEPL
jgi:hypothetical protein